MGSTGKVLRTLRLGGLKTKEVATEDDEGEEKFLDIVDIFNG